MQDDDFPGESYDPTEWVCAGFLRRFAAILLDFIVVAVVSVPVYFALLLAGVSEEAIEQNALSSLIQVAVLFVLHLVFWTRMGATPGKLAMGLRIVDVSTGEFMGPLRGTLRYFGYIVSAIPLYLGYLWMLWDPRSQTWHDKFGNSIVVRRA